MFTIKRISTTPNSPMRIQVDVPTEGDGGFQAGGVFYFEPAGADGDTHQVGEAAAKAIMHDPGLAEHFECTPEVPKPAPAADPEPDRAGGRGRRRKK